MSSEYYVLILQVLTNVKGHRVVKRQDHQNTEPSSSCEKGRKCLLESNFSMIGYANERYLPHHPRQVDPWQPVTRGRVN